MILFGLRKRFRNPKSPSPQLDAPDRAGLIKAPDESEQVNFPANRTADRRVLFVGCDPLWFKQAERDFLCLQRNWDCQLAKNMAEAKNAFANSSFDAMIVEGDAVNYSELKNLLQTSADGIICLTRCNLSDRTAIAHCQTSGATPVTADSDAAMLVADLKREEQLREWMSNPAIKKLLPQLKTLPAAPNLYVRISEELRSPRSSIADVAQLISQDPVMSAKILQLVNSAFFGLPREVTDTSEAVMVMGIEQVRSLILLVGVFTQYDASSCPGFSVESVWGHSLQAGVFARTIAFAELKDVRAAEAAFTAGLLHDIGKLILAGNVPQMYATVRRLQASKHVSTSEAETMVLGVTLAELGACLLGTWRLPLPVLEAIAWHQQPQHTKEKHFSLVTAVHVADALSAEGPNGENLGGGINADYLLNIGITDGGNHWRELCGIEPKTPPETLAERLRRRQEAKEN